MAAYFLDSSALGKAYRQEIGTAWTRGIMSPASRNDLYVAHICGAEVVAAIVRQQRAGNLSGPDAVLALTRFKTDFARDLLIVATDSAVIGNAMRMIEKHGLRGYDGVQLGSALHLHQARRAASLPDLTFLSADKNLTGTASAETLIVDDPNLHP